MLKKIKAFYTSRTKRDKMALMGIALVLLVVFFDRVILSMILSKFNALNEQIREEKAGIQKSFIVHFQKDTIIKEGREFMSYSVEAKNPEEEMTALLKEIEALADKASVSLLYVKPANVKEEKGTKKYMATLECEAQMEQIASLFHSIESSTKLLKIEKFEIQPKNKDSSIARCAITVSRTVLS
jgi:hypothetical protein